MKIYDSFDKLSVLMSIAVILQDPVQDIYRQGVNSHRFILISGKRCRKHATFHSMNQVSKAPPPWPCGPFPIRYCGSILEISVKVKDKSAS